MQPKMKYAGIAGILTGLVLLGEFVFFMLSGYTPDQFTNPVKALGFLRDSEIFLRTAVVFGALGVAVRMIYIAGLAKQLQEKNPTIAVATLYFGILGGVGHGLVALSFYVGIPAFIGFAAQDSVMAANGWGAFVAITSGFQSFGNFLLGLMLFFAGWAIVSHKALPKGVGIVGLLAGIASILGVFTTGTPLAMIGYLTFMPSLILAMLFDIWTGIALIKSKA